MRSFLRFVLVVTGFLGATSIYVGNRLIDGWPLAAANRGVVWSVLAFVVALQFFGPLTYRMLAARGRRVFLLHWITYASMGVFACVLFYTFAADVLVIAVGLTYGPAHIEEAVFMTAATMVLITVAVGFPQASLGPRVYRVDVPLANLPPSLEGFRIAQISDLHLGPQIGRRYAEKVVRLTNELSPNVIALTGDFVDGPTSELRHAAEALAGLRASDGVYFITGNHEYYSGAEPWVREFARLGARPLLNQHVSLRSGDLAIAGVTDFSPDWLKAAAGTPASAIKVLLAHHPVGMAEATEAGFHLQLSGHTHGGQFFPFSLFVRLKHRYYKGLYRIGALWLYVNRGTGYWGPPLRFGVPSEITLLTLRAASMPPAFKRS